MATPLDRKRARRHLERFELRTLFIEELGWDYGGEDANVTVRGRTYFLQAIAHKRGMVAYQYVAPSDDAFPDYPTRQKIEKAVANTVYEHIIVYAPPDTSAQYWQWVKRQTGQPAQQRQHIYNSGQSGEALIQKLENLVVTLAQEEDTSLMDMVGRVRAAFDVEPVTKRFYDRFKKEHDAFLGFIQGIQTLADREWYASLMLNRMMFIYFIQKQGFLDGDRHYLRNRLERMQREQGKDRFLSFYRLFLLRLFHEGLGQPEANRAPELGDLLGQVPYLNGGLFDVHDLERNHPNIQIPDEAFQRVFVFFDAYQWHLDDRPLRKGNEINPDVLGYVFEKYVNQKQMGAYYSKEDITGYISRNTVIPFLFDRARKECPIAFKPEGGVWRLLQDDPDRYFYDAVRHGITYDVHRKQDLEQKQELPPEIGAGLHDVSKRAGWNSPAPADYALPTETWREHVARRQRYEEVHAKLAAGEVKSINDLITYNLDIEKFARHVIAQSEGPELVRAFWKAIKKVSVLDPTCGSGAFLFAALNILEPLYDDCLTAMRGFLDDLERSGRNHHPERMSDFRETLGRVATHASERYFILKSIVIGNLYGVDIMEEAVEICKLRLFLKLVAQLESYDQIEPLPDIDFNIRAGNTLVGFASLDEIRSVLAADMVRQLALQDIEERAEIADRAFRQFRSMQTEHRMDAANFSQSKIVLRARLDDLRAELDRYHAGEYGIKVDDAEAYRRWRASHQPFHWLVEFYGIMCNGGFDVIIGNPPYVEYSKVRDTYQVYNLETTSCGNLYVLVMERSLHLLATRGLIGLIVPLSLVCTKRMSLARKLFHGISLWISCFDIRPSSLFEGIAQRLSIVIARREAGMPATHFGGGYHRWMSQERDSLFQRLGYVLISDHSKRSPFIPKLSSELERCILRKFGNRHLFDFISNNADEFVVHRIVRYFIKAFTFTPTFVDGSNNHGRSDDYKPFRFNQSERLVICALINSSLFYWFWRITSDGFHCGYDDVYAMPYDCVIDMPDRLQIERLLGRLMKDVVTNSRMKIVNTKRGAISYQEFDVKQSKPILDEIDAAFARSYGFASNELDYLINYDVKYRMGLNDERPENDA
jgi:hypothetical protein